MKKYMAGSLLLVVIAALSLFYIYREQNLAELLDIENVDRIHIVTEMKRSDEFELKKVNQETIDQLADYLKQYEVKLTNKDGWTSDYEQEQFNLYLGYKNGEMEIYTIERDVVVSTRIYEVVNAPLDYKWIQEFAEDNDFE